MEELQQEIKALQAQVAALTDLVKGRLIGRVVRPDAWYTYDDLERITGYKRGTLHCAVSKGKLKISPTAKVFYGQDVLDWLRPRGEAKDATL